MKALPLILLGALAFIARCGAQAHAGSDSGAANSAVIVVDFSNPGLSPSHWTLALRPDGGGHFRSEMGTALTGPAGEMRTPDVSRDVQLSRDFATSAFRIAEHHDFFNQQCESHLKVAFQGWKKLSYSGTGGHGSCTFNYSRDKEIQALGDNFLAVAETIVEGVRLEMLLQHDPLGLDKEIEALDQAAQSGRAQQLGVIRAILERLAQDDHVLDLVRRRARALLARAES